MIDSEYMERMRSPWCWKDYVECIGDRTTNVVLIYESDIKIIQYGYCPVALGDFYLRMIGEEDGETIYYY